MVEPAPKTDSETTATSPEVTAEEKAEQERKVKMWNDSQTMPEMGAFDRQMRIQNWNQSKVEESICLVLGVGGLGTGVALGLARLGVKKIILLDKDIVDITNMNRQVLFKLADVGLPKATFAKERLIENHVVSDKTTVEAHQYCALEHFDKVLDLIEQSNVVFNMIDVGELWDVAVQSACMKKKRLLIQGGTFCHQLSVDFFKPGEACVVCSAAPQDAETLAKLMPSKIESLANLEWIPRDRNPVAQSSVFCCQICAQMIVCRFAALLINDPEVEIIQRFIMTVNAGEVVQFPIEQEDTCPFCLEMGYVTKKEEAPVEETPKEEAPTEKNGWQMAGALALAAVAGTVMLLLKKKH